MSIQQTPAQQLGSVSQRYRRVTSCPAVWQKARPVRWPLTVSTDTSSTHDAGSQVGRRQRVEAVLLLARESLNSRKLAHHAGLADGTQARTVVRELNRLYDHAGRAFRVEEVAGGFRMLTRRQFAPWLRRLGHVPAEQRLSAPAMETLAVVAFRQPVLRAEIESIRGVGCGEILRQLMERDLVRISGRSQELGRPYLYTTTRCFLQLFGLQSLDQLPQIRDLQPGEPDGTAPTSPRLPESCDDPAEEERLDVKTTSLPTLVTPTVPTDADDQPDTLSSDFSVVAQVEEDDDEYDDEEYEDEYEEEEEEGDEDADEDDDWEEDEWEEVDDDELEDEELDDEELDDEELDDDWDDDEDDWEEDDEDDDEDDDEADDDEADDEDDEDDDEEEDDDEDVDEEEDWE